MTKKIGEGNRWVSHPLSCMTCDNGAWYSDHECVVGIVRCADDDIQAFFEGGTWALCCYGGGELEGRKPLPPKWDWWRWNPDWSREYSSILAKAAGPGRGNFRGAVVLLPPIGRPPAPVVSGAQERQATT